MHSPEIRGHDYVDTASLTADGADDTLQIRKVIVRTHGYGHAVHFVAYAVVEAVADDVNVVTAHRFVENALSFTAAETGAVCIYAEAFGGASPCLQIIVDLLSEFLTALHTDDTEIAVQFLHSEIPSFFDSEQTQ